MFIKKSKYVEIKTERNQNTDFDLRTIQAILKNETRKILVIFVISQRNHFVYQVSHIYLEDYPGGTWIVILYTCMATGFQNIP